MMPLPKDFGCPSRCLSFHLTCMVTQPSIMAQLQHRTAPIVTVVNLSAIEITDFHEHLLPQRVRSDF
jgi:hypothetical protein